MVAIALALVIVLITFVLPRFVVRGVADDAVGMSSPCHAVLEATPLDIRIA